LFSTVKEIGEEFVVRAAVFGRNVARFPKEGKKKEKGEKA